MFSEILDSFPCSQKSEYENTADSGNTVKTSSFDKISLLGKISLIPLTLLAQVFLV